MDTIKTRPRIRIEPSPTDKVVEAASVAGVAFLVAVTAMYWPMLPDRIPTHFDIAGKIDGWGSRAALLPPLLISTVTYVLMTILGRFPHTYNYPVPITEENAERQYRIAVSAIRWLKMEIVWMLACLNWQVMQIGLGRSTGFSPVVAFVGIAAMIGTTIVLVVRAYRAR